MPVMGMMGLIFIVLAILYAGFLFFFPLLINSKLKIIIEELRDIKSKIK
ncbi:MAG: hypothetical protein PHX78_04775 [bacterium]|nr:hypothetical protein [bacterium]